MRRVRERSPVGNLYVNRGITGAMVGRQPFGGNRLSGTGLKAGGPDYLLQFVEPRAVSENTMRHGLEVMTPATGSSLTSGRAGRSSSDHGRVSRGKLEAASSPRR